MTKSEKEFRATNWNEFARRYSTGTTHIGVVGKIETWGVFVALEDGLDALLHISHVLGLNGLPLSSVFATGQRIAVQIAEVDHVNLRIQLTCDVSSLQRIAPGMACEVDVNGSLSRIVNRLAAFRSFLLTFGFAYDREYYNAAKATGRFTDIVGVRFTDFFDGFKLIDILRTPESNAFFSYAWGSEKQPTLFIRPSGHVNPGSVRVPKNFDEIVEQIMPEIRDVEFEQIDFNGLTRKHSATAGTISAGTIHLACLVAYGRNRGVTDKPVFVVDMTHDGSNWLMLSIEDSREHIKATTVSKKSLAGTIAKTAGLAAGGAGAAAGFTALGGVAGLAAATTIAAPVVAAAALVGGCVSMWNRSRKTIQQENAPGDDKLLLLDGSNLVRQFPKYGCKTLALVIKAIEDRGWRYHVFFDRNIDHVLEENGDVEGIAYLAFLRKNSEDRLTVVPAGSQADQFMLMFADKRNCEIVSNDTFRNFSSRFPWLLDRSATRRVHSCSYVLDELLIPTLGLSVRIS